MKKSTKIILVIIVILLVVGIAVGVYCLTKNNDVSNEKKEKSSDSSKVEITNENNENTVESQNKDDEIINDDQALFVYSSADNAAMNGYPELLYVYKIDDNAIEFKYLAPWNSDDIKGVAQKTAPDTYTYVNGKYKIELLLNSLGENSVKVTEYKDNQISSWKNLWTDANVSDIINQNKIDNSEENKIDNNALNINGSYKCEQQTNNYYHLSNIVITNQTDTSINFSINAAHGNDVDHVNIGEVSGIAYKIDIPEDYIIPESEQIAYQYTENINGDVNKITLIYTSHRQFQYINVIEEYPSGINPYAGNRVSFSGEYEKIN